MGLGDLANRYEKRSKITCFDNQPVADERVFAEEPAAFLELLSVASV